MTNKSVYVGAILADVHFGAMPAEKLYEELEKGFLKYLKSLKILNYVVLAGDLFDGRLNLNSAHTKYMFIFLKKLMEICVDKNCKLRILKGTLSHDNDQLNVLKLFSNFNVDFKIIETVTSEDLFHDMKVLYIPEEYIDNGDYYKEYFNTEYDMIFGHGMFSEVAFMGKNQTSEITMKKAPIFKSEDILNISKGPVVFGHIHKSQCIKDRIYYVGSYSRWVYGEEDPKGFMMCAYTPETSNYEIEFIENKNAPLYNSLIIDYNSAFYRDDQNQQMDYIIRMINNLNVERLRVIFNIPETYENPILLTNLINDVFAKYKNIKVVINNNSKEQRKKREMEEKIKLLLSKYDFIFDKSVSPEEKLSKFIKIKYNKDITVDNMRNYLYQKINFK